MAKAAIALKQKIPPATDVQLVGGQFLESLARVVAQQTIEQLGDIMTRNEVTALVTAELAKQPEAKQQQLYRVASVAKMMDVSTQTVWNYVKKRILPEPTRLSEGLVVFAAEDVHLAIAKIKAGEIVREGSNG